MRALLPDLKGKSVVDLRRGYGWFARWVVEHGAQHVLGLDVSEKMQQRGVAHGEDPRISYRLADLEQLHLPSAGFDLAYSSLAIHYIVNPRGHSRLAVTVYADSISDTHPQSAA